MPKILTEQGPKRIAPRPVPVIWEQLPVTEGIFKDEMTKINAPDMARSVRARLFSSNVFLSFINPVTRNGRHKMPHATQ